MRTCQRHTTYIYIFYILWWTLFRDIIFGRAIPFRSFIPKERSLCSYVKRTHVRVYARFIVQCLRYLNWFWRDSSRRLSVYNDGYIMETRVYKPRSVRHTMGARDDYANNKHQPFTRRQTDGDSCCPPPST